MEINNLYNIQQILKYESKDIFYHLQIIQRRKEVKDAPTNARVIKTYYVTSNEYLNLKMPEIINLCNFHNARAYINLTSRSFERIAFHTLKKVTDCIMNKDYKSISKSFESVCGEYGFGEKYWIIDVDNQDLNLVLDIANVVDRMQSGNSKNVVTFLPTLNGWHIITKPFNLKEFEPYNAHYMLEIHKNNPTLLYYNKNEY